MQKRVVHHIVKKMKLAFPGLSGIDWMAHEFPIEPFLVLTEFYMDKPVFGPHPHAGISVMTYILPDSKNSFINRDSRGDFSEIKPGGMHVTQAGIGIQHDEFPKTTGIPAHGFQIWINHSAKNRFIEPKAFKAAPDQIAEVHQEGTNIRLLQGKLGKQEAPFALATEIALFHVLMDAGRSISLDAREMAFLYGIEGRAFVDSTTVSGGTMVIFSEDGDRITIKTESENASLLFGSGTPHREPIAYGGPFVMNTRDELEQTKRRYQRGEMGELLPYDNG